ncbi:MAG: hypothetical protein V2A70_02415 [Candidatus Omnitrophota bacterium]
MGRLIKIFPFMVLFLYWAYLVVMTRPVLIYDALGYENLGRLIMENGWGMYFRELNREPFFPFLISVAMRLEQVSGVGYNYILKVFLLIELALAMAGTYRLARLLGAGRWWALGGAWYLGVSPAIVNSTLWLWSEAAVYPFVIWGIIWLIYAWQEIFSQRSVCYLLGYTALASVLFIFAAMVKASLAVVFVGLLMPYYACVIHGLWLKHARQIYRALLVSLIGVLMMGAYVENHKFLNWRGNGNYAITNRADVALLGNTVRRLHPQALHLIPQAILAAPRLGICEKYYGASCAFWSALTSDKINDQYGQQLRAEGFSDTQRRQMFLMTAFGLMREHPFQEVFFAGIEGMKMFFWENRLYFVKYPDALARFFTNHAVVYTLCFVFAVLSLAGLLSTAWRAFRYRRMPDLFAVLFVIFFIGSYMLFFVDIRYGFPLAPVFMAMIAAMGQVLRVSMLKEET